MNSLAATVLALLQTSAPLPSQPAEPTRTAEDLQIAMIGPGIGVADIERSIRFYRDGLGLRILRRLPNAHGEEVMLGFGTATMPLLVLVRHDGSARRAAGAAGDKIMLSVRDADQAAARLTAAGFAPAPVQRNPRMGVATFWVTDPDGHRLEIVARTAPAR